MSHVASAGVCQGYYVYYEVMKNCSPRREFTSKPLNWHMSVHMFAPPHKREKTSFSLINVGDFIGSVLLLFVFLFLTKLGNVLVEAWIKSDARKKKQNYCYLSSAQWIIVIFVSFVSRQCHT